MTTSTSTRKAPAKRLPAKQAPAKAPAKKAAPKLVESTSKPAPEKILHTAVGRSGQAVFRRFDKVMTHAVDVADSTATKPLPRSGQVSAFFPSEERAKSWASKKVVEGYDAVVIKAEVVK